MADERTVAMIVNDLYYAQKDGCHKHVGTGRICYGCVEDALTAERKEVATLRARVAELENNLEMLHFSPPNIGHDAIILRPLFECIEFARWHDGKRESAGTSPNVLGAFDLAIEDADARWFHDANDHDEGKSFYDRRDYKAVEARAEAAESRLTQLEGALRDRIHHFSTGQEGFVRKHTEYVKGMRWALDILRKERAEAAESRLTQLEGALRNLRNQVQGANAIAHHEILAAIGVTNARCIERALAEADAALTPVVKQEEP